MSSANIVLDVYSSPFECLYRIQRARKVVYVLVNDPEIIPEDSRTFPPAIIRELSKLEGWSNDWDTLTVDRDQSGVSVKLNGFKPHGLPEQFIQHDLRQVNILDLKILHQVKYRTLYANLDGMPCYVKFARFSFELQDVEQEVEAYRYLMDRGFTMIPNFLGYVNEGNEGSQRVIGFLLEKIQGRHANINDLSRCEEALAKLHKFIVHGDLNQYNIIITDNGPKFIDLERSSTKPDNENIEWEEQAAKEMQSLRTALSDDSGKGRPSLS